MAGGGIAGLAAAIAARRAGWEARLFEQAAEFAEVGAGLQLGLRLLAPGRQRRVDALAEGGRRGALLYAGVFVMLVLAAFVEAFWSSIGWMPASFSFWFAASRSSIVVGVSVMPACSNRSVLYQMPSGRTEVGRP